MMEKTVAITLTLLMMTGFLTLPAHSVRADEIISTTPIAGEYIGGITHFEVTDAGTATRCELWIDGMLITYMTNIGAGLWGYDLDMTSYEDGPMFVQFRSIGPTSLEDDVVGFFVNVENDLPVISNVQFHYPMSDNGCLPGEIIYVSAVIEEPNPFFAVVNTGPFIEALPIPMNDIGTGNDAIPGDGIYTSDDLTVVPATPEGLYGVEVYAENPLWNTDVTEYIQIFSNQPDSIIVDFMNPLDWSPVSSGFPVNAVTWGSMSMAEVDAVYLNSSAEPTIYSMTYNPATISWEYEFPSGTFPDGPMTLYVRGINEVGMISAESSIDLWVDSTLPSIAVLSPLDGEILTGESIILLNSTDDVPIPPATNISIDGGAETNMTYVSGLPYNFYFILNTTVMADGEHTITITATDWVGNQVEKSITMTVDNNMMSPLTCQIMNPAANEFCENSITFQVSATDGGGVHNVSLELYDSDFWFQVIDTEMILDAATGLWVCTLNSAVLPDGNYTLIVTAYDNVGFFEFDMTDFHIDNNAPNLNVMDPVNGLEVSGSWEIVAGGFDIFPVTIEYSIDSGNRKSIATLWDTFSFADGPHTVSVFATDLAGHETTQTMTVYVNNMNPTCQVVYPMDGATLSGQVTLKFSATDANGIDMVTYSLIDDVMSPILTSVSTMYNTVTGCWEYPLDTTLFTPGQYYISSTAYDNFGNSTTSPLYLFDISEIIGDSDGDGIADDLDDFPSDPLEWEDTDGDLVGDNSDQFPLDPTEYIDSDGDGIGDNSDIYPDDYDNDGYDDYVDVFPTNPNEWNDTDSDGFGDNSDPYPNDPLNIAPPQDTDGDGVPDSADAFPNDNGEWEDSDGDGIGDNTDDFALNPNEWLDTDGDTYGDNSDAFPLDINEWLDSDGDGTGDNADTYPLDYDNDGYNDTIDLFPLNPNEWADSDADGLGDNSDPYPDDPLNLPEGGDTDEDGYADGIDAFPLNPDEWLDTDCDGFGDNSDPYPNDPLNIPPPDMDSDGIPDSVDTDIDGDGYLNTNDPFPTNPNEWSDLDGDGTGDNSDLDIDGDHVGNDQDYYPYMSEYYSYEDGFYNSTVDTDGDGIPDEFDWDSDNDGYPDCIESEYGTNPFDPDDKPMDGPVPESFLDMDEDGVSNDVEVQLGYNPLDDESTPPDMDSDGIPDQLDIDIDGDTVGNTLDAYPMDPLAFQFPAEEEGIGLDMILLIVVLVISIISLAVSITGKRHGSDSHEVSGGNQDQMLMFQGREISEDEIQLGKIKLETPNGTIEVELPDDIHTGDVISGTVVAEPKGKNEKQKVKNKNILNGYVVDLEKKPKLPKEDKKSTPIPEKGDSGPSPQKLTKEEEEEVMKNFDESIRKNADNVNKNEDFSSEDKNSKEKKKEDSAYEDPEYGEITEKGAESKAERQTSYDRLG